MRRRTPPRAGLALRFEPAESDTAVAARTIRVDSRVTLAGCKTLAARTRFASQKSQCTLDRCHPRINASLVARSVAIRTAQAARTLNTLFLQHVHRICTRNARDLSTQPDCWLIERCLRASIHCRSHAVCTAKRSTHAASRSNSRRHPPRRPQRPSAMQLKALTSAALLAGAQAFVAPGASKPALALRAEEVEAAPVEVAPVAEAAPEAEVVAPVAEVAAVAPEPVLTTPSVRSTRAPPRAWDIALDMPAGISAPFGYFDPAGLGKKVSEQRAKYFRECELKHGRVAMLAAFGFPVAEHFHPLFGGNIDVPSYVAYQQTPLQTFWPVVLLYVGIVEIFSVFTFENPFGKGGFWTLKDDRVRTTASRLRRFWLGPHGLHAIAATRRAKAASQMPRRVVEQRHDSSTGSENPFGKPRGGLTRVSLRRYPATSAGTPWTCTLRTPRAASRCRPKS